MAIEPKEAVRIALTYVADLFEDEKPGDLALEELDSTKDGKYWLVTVGFSRGSDRVAFATGMAAVFGSQRRQYKIVKINKNTGSVLAVKIRPKATAQDVE